MSTEPRITRTTPVGDITHEDPGDLPPVVAVLRWGGYIAPKVETVPALRVATARSGSRVTAVRVRWAWQPGGRDTRHEREDWLRRIDVLDHWPQPDTGEWEQIQRARVYES